MTTDFSAGPQTTQLWDRVRPIVEQIESLPFLGQLAEGSLDVKAFTNYIIQDGIYLTGYAEGDVVPRRRSQRPGRSTILGQFGSRGHHGGRGDAR